MTIYSNRINVIAISRSIPNLRLMITNTQNVSTPEGLQVLATVPLTFEKYSLDFSKFAFYYNNNPVYSWVESVSNGSMNVWLKMPVSIPANTSITINAIPNNKTVFDNNYWGCAPTLTNQYGQYDNGANVFNFYDNFAGTSLNTNNWITVSTPPSGVITINNGASVINTGNSVYYVSSKSFTAPYIIDIGGILGVNADGGPWFDLESTTSTTNIGYLWATRGTNIGKDQLYTDANNSYNSFATASGYSATSSFAIYTLEDIGGSSGTIQTYVNYTSWLSGANTTFTHSGYFDPFRHCNTRTPSSVIYWVRARTYPPNGVMPSVTVSY